MMPMEKLLDEISHELPCGEDFEAGKGRGEESGELNPLEELQERIKPTASGEKDWKSITASANELLGRSKDLRLALVLCLGLLKTEQLVGFKQGLSFLRALLEKYWENLYPPLKDGNPTRRVNVLNSLSMPPHQANVSFDFVRTLRQVTLVRPTRGAPVTWNDILASDKAPAKEGGNADLLAGTDPVAIRQTHELLNAISSELDAIQSFLDEKGARPTFSIIQDTLKQMTEHVGEHVKTEVKPDAQKPDLAGAPSQVPRESAPRNGHGRIQSVDDVVSMIGEICKYYEINDRSSPVPLLLKRAQRLTKMNFYEIMEDLTPEEIAKLKLSCKE